MIKATGLIGPVIIPLILSGLLLFSSEKNNRPKKYLVIYMLIIAYVFFANYFYFEKQYIVYSWLHSLHIASVLAIYPGAFIYVKLLTNPGISLRKLSIHFFPSLIFFTTSALIFFPFLNQEERLYFLSEYRLDPDFSKTSLKVLYYVRMGNIIVLFGQVFFYLFLTFTELKKHREKVRELFSNPEKYQLNWVRIFNILLALSAFICVFLYAVNPAKLLGDERFLAYPMLLIAIILWFFGIMGNNQSQVVKEIMVDPEKDGRLNDLGLQSDSLAIKLVEMFEKEKPYLNPELKIWDISARLFTNRTYISKTINTKFGQNFSSFVNGYRINEAKEIMQKYPDKDIYSLADESGFGSALSFNRAFREKIGMNVNEFKAQYKNQKV